MSQNGINPLEVVAVFKDDEDNLIVAEGNRRICAAQLLCDYHKTPEANRARFKALSKKSISVSQVNIAEFPDYETAEPWLLILHDGEQDGIGRRRWKPDQKARATKNKSTNALAVALLDYAQDQDIVDAQERPKLSVSTVTRYLANPGVRAAMRITSAATSDKISTTTDDKTLSCIVKTFFDDLRSGLLNSRSATKDWLNYADKLRNEFSDENIEKEKKKDGQSSRKDPAGKKTSNVGRTRVTTPNTRYIVRSPEFIRYLNQLGSFKISSIYKSLTDLPLDEHPALLMTGAWVFLENLTALHGRDSNSDFVSYSCGKFGGWGFSKDKSKDCRLSLNFVSQQGNTQKHSGSSGVVDARNLNNHFNVLEDVFINLIKECSSVKKV